MLFLKKHVYLHVFIKSLVIPLVLLNAGSLLAQGSEVKAVPVGGLKRYLKWIDQHIVYTDSARIVGIYGQVAAEFVVETDGSLSSVRVVDSIGFGVEESLRQAVLAAPAWQPAMNNGIPIRTSYRLGVPVVDMLQQTVPRRRHPDDPSSVARVEAYPSMVRDTTILDSVGLPAEPPGGMDGFMKWVMQNYRFPSGAVDAGVNGTVLIQFVVELDGSLTNFKILKDLGHGTGKEAVQLLRKSRRWKPAIANGRPVRSKYDLPIKLMAI